MSNDFKTMIKNAWKRDKLGTSLFTIGSILFEASIIISIIERLGLIPFTENTPIVVLMIGIGVPFILSGICIHLQPSKFPLSVYKGIYERYIEENMILIIECMTSIIAITLLFMSYPDGWHYPYVYIMILPYIICIILMTTNILSNIDKKEEEIDFIRRELEDSKRTIKEKDELNQDNAAPEYVTSFATGLKRNIDELISIMGVLKTSIDKGSKNITDITISVANKYRLDNEQLHKDVQNFKQRTEKDKTDSKERANERMIKSLMGTLYNIDELKRYKEKDAYTVGDVDKIKEDIYNILKVEDIEIINPSIGDDFDDKKCCAIQIIDTDKFPGKKVVDIKKIGCMFKSGKVIKYADVIVSKGKDNKEDVKVDNKEDIKISEIVELGDKGQIVRNKITDGKVDTKVDINIEKDINDKADTKVDTKIENDIKDKVDTKEKTEDKRIFRRIKIPKWR